MIDSAEKLARFVPTVRTAAWLAVDTEADSLHSYPEKLCLVQLSLPSKEVLVDPLAGVDLAPLWAALDGRELIFHGADYDLRLLRRSSGFVPHTVFDTMLAARLLGVAAFGLTDLAEAFLGVKLEKGPQKADWSRRPLTDRMLAYARNDTRYLKPLADRLSAELRERGRLSWHQQMCAQLVQICAQPEVEDPDGVWRLKGADRLDRRSLAVVRELWQWREREARKANKPPFFVLPHGALIVLAAAAGQGRPVDALIPRHYSNHRREGVRQAIARGLALPESKLPYHRRHRGRHLTPADKRRLEELRLRRDARAAELNLDPTVIASRATLTALAVNREEHQAELLSWQRELLAD